MWTVDVGGDSTVDCTVIYFSDYASIDNLDVGGDLIGDYTAALMNPSAHQTHQQGTSHSHQEDPEEVNLEFFTFETRA